MKKRGRPLNLLPELVAIEAYRVEHDLTWEELGAEMLAANCKVPSRTLNYLCKRAKLDAIVRDRTIYKIQNFLTVKGVVLPRPTVIIGGAALIPVHPALTRPAKPRTRRRRPRQLAAIA